MRGLWVVRSRFYGGRGTLGAAHRQGSAMRPRRLASSVSLAALFACAGWAGAATAPPEPVESLLLMSVEGQVVIAPDGSVDALEIASKISPDLQAALEARLRAWRFAPVRVGGAPTRAQTRFELTLAAVRTGDRLGIRIEGANFGDATAKAAIVPDGMAEPITPISMPAPLYPQSLQAANQTGRVLLAILVSPDGRVEQVSAAQSLAFDFRHRQTDAAALRTMHVLERNAIRAARQWRFKVPAATAALPPARRTVMGVVEYVLVYDTGKSGQWLPVQRGPRHPLDWMPPDRRDAGVALGASGGTQLSGLDSPYRLVAAADGQPVM
jgi:TonB family protein